VNIGGAAVGPCEAERTFAGNASGAGDDVVAIDTISLRRRRSLWMGE